jgi:hypothetical protein
MMEAEHRHEGAVTMIDSKGRKTTLTLEPEQVAIVPGLEPSRSAAFCQSRNRHYAGRRSIRHSTSFLHRPSWYAWIRMRISPLTWPSGTKKSSMGR